MGGDETTISLDEEDKLAKRNQDGVARTIRNREGQRKQASIGHLAEGRPESRTRNVQA